MRTRFYFAAMASVLLVFDAAGIGHPGIVESKPGPQNQEVGQSAPLLPKITLLGISAVVGDKKALLKVETQPNSLGASKMESLILGEHQKSGQVEVFEINQEAGTVRLRCSGVVTTLSLNMDDATAGAEVPQTIPRLSGLINLPEMKLVRIDIASPVGLDKFFLAKGQAADKIEVIEIQPQKGTAKLRLLKNNSIVVVTNTALKIEGDVSGIALENVEIGSLFWLLGELSQRTILHPVLEIEPIRSLMVAATNREDAARLLGESLQKHGLFTVRDGTRFLMALPKTMVAKSESGSLPIDASGELLPAGVIYFPHTSIRQVAPIYAELKNCKLEDIPGSFSDQPIEFNNQTPLTREESLYALDKVLGWAGVKLVPAGEGRIKLIRVKTAER
jgi:hypothetical protein